MYVDRPKTLNRCPDCLKAENGCKFANQSCYNCITGALETVFDKSVSQMMASVSALKDFDIYKLFFCCCPFHLLEDTYVMVHLKPIIGLSDDCLDQDDLKTGLMTWPNSWPPSWCMYSQYGCSLMILIFHTLEKYNTVRNWGCKMLLGIHVMHLQNYTISNGHVI